jgi:transcriptional regulator with XRE-family HTH domain
MAREPTIGQLLGDRIRALRERQQLTQADLARLSELSRSQILLLERGERAPTVVTVASVARALGVPVGDLLDPVTQANPGPDRADRLATRARALGPAGLDAVERVIDALEQFASAEGRDDRPTRSRRRGKS